MLDGLVITLERGGFSLGFTFDKMGRKCAILISWKHVKRDIHVDTVED